ncbi:urokinase plasminogen activator surface receptor isoform X2 [Heterodontus francisci]|uniref:urokinase plasminogen activator surface receptor isoform X2 n=1 Tax=Heterodontus francisci TaxID=7792 RepID=UPI00355B8103
MASFRGRALKCYTCVASSEEDCNKQGPQTCPQFADSCSIITGPSSVIKSCSYKAFCDQKQLASGGVNMDCCFTDDCNGPAKGKSASTGNNSGTTILYNPTLILSAFLARWLLCTL